MAELADHRNDFAKKNGELIIIGPGDPSAIDEFKQITGFAGNVYTDPSRKSYQEAGLSSGVGGLFGIKTWTRGFSALLQGVKPGKIQGNPLQLGGAVIVTPEREIVYHYRSSEAGDDPPIGEMVAALNT